MIGSSNLVRKSTLLGAFALFLGLAVFIHWTNGGFEDEFGGEPDAASHFVTGLMVRDYLASRAPASAMEYASNYYLHYPKVSLGHWPPFFYVVEGAWMLLFTVSPLSLGLMMSVLVAVLATLLSEAAREEFCTGTGLALGVLAASAPLTQSASRTVMMECLVALLVFRATLAFGRYLDTGRWLHAAWFGVIASLACLTKGVAFFLGVLPPLGTIIRGDFRLFKRPPWWLPAFVVAALCAPWYLLAPGALHGSADLPYGVFAIVRPWDPFRMLFALTLQNLGWWLVPFLVIGIADRIVYPLWVGNRVTGFWAANAALVLALPLFSACIQPAREPRHFVSLIPPLLLFTAAGVARVFRVIPLSDRKPRPPLSPSRL
jgi:4-amino-4-deoxy-L-arabinose transferase-like glycosyltransferase